MKNTNIFHLLRVCFPVAQMVKNWAAMQETWLLQETQVRSLGQKDPLEKGMATHSSTLAWRIPWMEEPGGVQSMGLQRVGHNWATNTFTFREPQTDFKFWFLSVENVLCWNYFLTPFLILSKKENVINNDQVYNRKEKVKLWKNLCLWNKCS